MKRDVAYTAGTFDLFHVGHLRILKAASELADTLIVGVSTDELVESYKGLRPTVPFEERLEIVSCVKGVELAVPQRTQDKFEMWERLQFDTWAVGDDWFESTKYQGYKKQLEEVGVRCVFLPYTTGVSSTLRRKVVERSDDER